MDCAKGAACCSCVRVVENDDDEYENPVYIQFLLFNRPLEGVLSSYAEVNRGTDS